MSKHYVLDFDGTLFNVGMLWDRWLDELEACDVDREDAIDKGNQLFGEGFTLREHGQQMGIEADELDELVSGFEEYIQAEALTMLYPDVVPFLQERDATFTLLTFGDHDFQHFKIEAAGLDEFIEDIRIARPERRKPIQLKELCESTDDEVIFIDDNPRELAAVLDDGLPVTVVRMMRGGLRNADAHAGDGERWQTIKSLLEIE